MSGIEKAAKPSLLAGIKDYEVVMGAEVQRRIATWVTTVNDRPDPVVFAVLCGEED